MFIDYVTIMLVNVVAGLVLIALFVFKYLTENQKVMAPGFLITGTIGAVTGFAMIFTWPLPGSYNMAYGESEVLFGVLMLGLAFSIIMGYDFLTVTIYAFFAGLSLIVIGIGILIYKMSTLPVLTALGFFGAGAGGVLSIVVYLLKKNKVIRGIFASILLITAIIFSITAYSSDFAHLKNFKGYQPRTMQVPSNPK